MSAFGKVKTVVNALIRRGYWYNNDFMPDMRKFNLYSVFNTQVVNLGSTSGVAAFDYSGLNVKAANWALRRNPLAGDWAVLRNYSSYLDKNGSTVIISLCPFSTLSGGYQPFEDRYYSVLYPSTIPYYSYVHDVQAQERIQNPIRYYPWFAYFTDIWHALFKDGNKTLADDKMEIDAENKLKGWLHEFALTDFNTPFSLWNKDHINEAIGLLNNMIVFCKERNATPVFVVPPMYQSLANKFSVEARNLLFGDIDQLAKEKGVKFINYMDDSQFVDNRILFKDSFLMNNKGAKMFTKRVLSDLKLI